ncbi:MAG TPA: hypothetical protein VFF03_05550 [Rhodocyclaceae bacterium]|nr:hypothetical protein [Rhodocyclaceae bacterium]
MAASAVFPYSQLCPATIFTQHSINDISSAHRAGKAGIEFWSKAAGGQDVDTRASLPRLNADAWADFVAARLRPYSAAQHRALEQLSPLLPRALAHLCDQLAAVCVPADKLRDERIATRIKNDRDDSRDALWTACRLGEMTKELLFALVAGFCAQQGDLPEEVAAFAAGGATRSATEVQQIKEDYLQTMLLRLASGDGKAGPYACGRFFSHLDVVAGAKQTQIEFIQGGLKVLRQARNRLAHRQVSPPFDQEWAEIAIALRRVMDALAFFGSFGLLARCRLVSPGHLQASRFDAVNSVLQTLAVERIGLFPPDPSRAELDPRQLYALWPSAAGSVGLIPLWPWVARLRSNGDEALRTYFYVGRNGKGAPLGLELDTWEVETFSQGENAGRWRQALDAINTGR